MRLGLLTVGVVLLVAGVGCHARTKPAAAPRADADAKAQKLIDEYERDVQAIQRHADPAIQARKQKLIEQLQTLEAGYRREGKQAQAEAVQARLVGLKGEGAGKSDPGTLVEYRNQVGKSFTFEVTGSTQGIVYGTDVYTDDSTLDTAAVHAGVLRDGQKGLVKVTMVEGKASYEASTRNGVTSRSWGVWFGSYKVEPATKASAVKPDGREVQPDPGDLRTLRDQVGKTFRFEVVGSRTGFLWGTDVYTDDSTLAAAAVHAGVLSDGQKGVVKVTVLAGREGYEASTRNGVSSGSWGSWPGSYRVEATKK